MSILEIKQGLPVPPWIIYPELDPASDAPVSDECNLYISEFSEWLQSQENAVDYFNKYPYPITWNPRAIELGREVSEKLNLPAWTWNKVPLYCVENAIGKEIYPFFGHDFALDEATTDSCLSNWWLKDFSIHGVIYCCVEQFMMASKARMFDDAEMEEKIMECQDPKLMKQMGRKIKNFDAEAWDKVKYLVVLNGNWCKFSQNPELRRFLVSTDDAFIAGASLYDSVWGIKLSKKSSMCKNPLFWKGQNLLGFALTEVREEIKRVFGDEV